MRAYLRLFKNRDYANIWIGQTMSVFGDSLYQVAFYWLAYKLSSSPTLAGLVIFASSAPYIFLGLIGGAYADRMDRKKIMITSDVIRMLTVAVVPFASLTSTLSLALVAAVAFLLTSVRCFFYPAAKSAVADVLDEEERGLGVALLQASFQASRVIGLAISGFLIARFSASIVYSLPVITYLISVVFLVPLKRTSKPSDSSPGQTILAEVIDTVRFIRPQPSLFWSIALFGLGLLVITGIDRVALPALSDRIWGVGPDGLGIMLAAFSIGNVAASLGLGLLQIKHFARTIFIGWALWGVFYALVGSSPFFSLAFVFAFLAGASEAVIDVPLVILIQTSVPRERMGKVFSMWSTVAFIGEAGSALVAGFVVGTLGPAQGYYASGAGLIAVAALGLFLTRAKRAAQVEPSLI
jgi:MFS family permease